MLPTYPQFSQPQTQFHYMYVYPGANDQNNMMYQQPSTNMSFQPQSFMQAQPYLPMINTLYNGGSGIQMSQQFQSGGNNSNGNLGKYSQVGGSGMSFGQISSGGHINQSSSGQISNEKKDKEKDKDKDSQVAESESYSNNSEKSQDEQSKFLAEYSMFAKQQQIILSFYNRLNQCNGSDSPKISKNKQKFILKRYDKKNGGGGESNSCAAAASAEAQKFKKVQKKVSHSKRIKNCPRYIIKQIIRSMKDFPEKIQQLCDTFNVDFEALVRYFTTNIETFTNFNMIQQHWVADDADASEQAKRNLIFRKYSKFFLEEKAVRYILLRGVMKKENKKYYLYTVRHMLKHIDHPETYRSNFF